MVVSQPLNSSVVQGWAGIQAPHQPLMTADSANSRPTVVALAQRFWLYTCIKTSPSRWQQQGVGARDSKGNNLAACVSGLTAGMGASLPASDVPPERALPWHEPVRAVP